MRLTEYRAINDIVGSKFETFESLIKKKFAKNKVREVNIVSCDHVTSSEQHYA